MATKRGNPQNFLDPNKMTPEERQERARNGGRKSGIVRRDKRTSRERLALLLQLAMTDNEGHGIKSPITGKAMSVGEAIDTAVIKKAVKGDIRAVEVIYDLLNVRVTRTEITGAKGKDLIPAKLDVSSLSDEQLKAIASIKVKEDNEP